MVVNACLFVTGSVAMMVTGIEVVSRQELVAVRVVVIIMVTTVPRTKRRDRFCLPWSPV